MCPLQPPAKFGDFGKSNLHPSIYDLLHPLNLKASLFSPFVNCVSFIMWLTRMKFSSNSMVVYINVLNSDGRPTWAKEQKKIVT